MAHLYRNKLPDQIPALQEFEGIINTRRSKDIGYNGLTVARNVEVTDTKKLVRRNGYRREISAAFSGLYGAVSQGRMLAVQGSSLVLVTRVLEQRILTTGLLPGAYSWSEDPAANIYYTSDVGSNGVVRVDDVWLPLSLAVPSISAVAVVTTAPWAVVPFNLGKTYDVNAMHLIATYLYPDGRESAPGEIVSVSVAPEVELLRATVPLQAGCITCVYATAPGGSRYYLVAEATTPTFTFRVKFLHQQYNGPAYEYTTSISSFPVDAYLLAHFNGRLHAATYDHATETGTVYYSLPLQYHLFDPLRLAIGVAGVPLLLLLCKEGLIIGTSDEIYLWNSEKLEPLADYGVMPGQCGDVTPKGLAYFWTTRGVAKAMPYELITEERFSGDPGVFCNAKLFYDRGYTKLVASTISGNPTFNRWSAR